MSDATETIKFNVGGRHFEVSRALVIDGHSETVLGKLVSDTWNDDIGKPVFLDRDGNIFAQILNYLRYGSIELPVTIPRPMFNRELDYYGISSAEDRISDQGSLARTLKDQFLKAKREHDMYLLAVECYNQVCQAASLLTVNFSVRIPQQHKLYNQKDLDSEERRLFDKYLEGYFGLKIVNLTRGGKSEPYTAIELAFTTNVIVE